jgi:hypothetical protein
MQLDVLPVSCGWLCELMLDAGHWFCPFARTLYTPCPRAQGRHQLAAAVDCAAVPAAVLQAAATQTHSLLLIPWHPLVVLPGSTDSLKSQVWQYSIPCQLRSPSEGGLFSHSIHGLSREVDLPCSAVSKCIKATSIWFVVEAGQSTNPTL